MQRFAFWIVLTASLLAMCRALQAAETRVIELQYRTAQTLLQSVQPLWQDRLLLVALEDTLIASGPSTALNELSQLITQLDRPPARYQVELSDGTADITETLQRGHYSTRRNDLFSLTLTAYQPAYIERSDWLVLCNQFDLEFGIDLSCAEASYQPLTQGFYLTLRPRPGAAAEVAISMLTQRFDAHLDTVWGPGLRGHRLVTVQQIPLNEWVVLGTHRRASLPRPDTGTTYRNSHRRQQLAIRVHPLYP